MSDKLSNKQILIGIGIVVSILLMLIYFSYFNAQRGGDIENLPLTIERDSTIYYFIRGIGIEVGSTYHIEWRCHSPNNPIGVKVFVANNLPDKIENNEDIEFQNLKYLSGEDFFINGGRFNPEYRDYWLIGFKNNLTEEISITISLQIFRWFSWRVNNLMNIFQNILAVIVPISAIISLIISTNNLAKLRKSKDKEEIRKIIKEELKREKESNNQLIS